MWSVRSSIFGSGEGRREDAKDADEANDAKERKTTMEKKLRIAYGFSVSFVGILGIFPSPQPRRSVFHELTLLLGLSRHDVHSFAEDQEGNA